MFFQYFRLKKRRVDCCANVFLDCRNSLAFQFVFFEYSVDVDVFLNR